MGGRADAARQVSLRLPQIADWRSASQPRAATRLDQGPRVAITVLTQSDRKGTLSHQTGNFPLKFGCKMNFISFLFAGCPCSRVHVAGYVHLKILSGVQNRDETARLSCDNNKILVSAQNHTRETITRPATIFGRGEILLKRGPAPFPRLSLPSSRRGRTVHPTPATR